tara:strand:- start:227 stop:583 length:357 start_codon:yes stop_codon:yes gene_type:complete
VHVGLGEGVPRNELDNESILVAIQEPRPQPIRTRALVSESAELRVYPKLCERTKELDHHKFAGEDDAVDIVAEAGGELRDRVRSPGSRQSGRAQQTLQRGHLWSVIHWEHAAERRAAR